MKIKVHKSEIFTDAWSVGMGKGEGNELSIKAMNELIANVQELTVK